MTTGGAGGGGGGSFEHGSDYVAARVSVDVDASGIQTLRELSQEIDRMRTASEAAARSSANFKSYLDAVSQSASTATSMHRELAAQMERTAEMQQRMMGGGGGGASAGLSMSRLAPQSYTDPWAGMGAGMGGVRAPSPSDVQAQIQQQNIDPTRQLDPRKYINAQAGRYNLNPGELPVQNLDEPQLRATADRIDARERQGREQEQRVSAPPGQQPGGGLAGHASRYAGLAGNIMNEMAPGGSHAGMLNLAARGMQAAGKSLSGAFRPSGAVAAGEGSASEGGGNAIQAAGGDLAGSELSGGVSGMLRGAGGALGAGGMVAGGALAGLAAFEKGGSMIQGYKNMGLIRGGGAGQGFGDEMSIRTMALNPFLTTEQSRQIIMAGLTEGYSGKQFDSVTNFMADNLKNMNIQVSDSVQMLRTNVNQGQQSVMGLGASLAVLKGMAPGSAMSLPDMAQNFQQTNAALVSQGVPGGMASQESLGGMGVWNGPDTMALKGDFNQIMGSMGSTPQGGALLKAWGGAQTPPGLNPAMTSAYLGQHGGGLGKATGQALQHIYQMSFRTAASKQKGSTEYLNSLYIFQKFLAQVSPNDPAVSNTDVAMQMVDQLAKGGNPYDEGQKKRDEVSSQVKSTGIMGSGVNALNVVGSSISDLGKGFAGWMSGNDTAFENARSDFGKTWSNASYNETAQASNPVLDNVVGQLGAGSVQVVDSQGNGSPLTGSKQQVSDLAAGKLKWRPKGSEGGGYTLQQTPASGDVPGGGGGSKTNVSFDPAQVQITIDNQGKATASPNPVQLTTNQVQAQAGYGSGTLNNNPPNGYDKNKYLQ